MAMEIGGTVVEDALHFLLSAERENRFSWSQLKDDFSETFLNADYASNLAWALGSGVKNVLLTKPASLGVDMFMTAGVNGSMADTADCAMSLVGTALTMRAGLSVESSLFNGIELSGNDWCRVHHDVNIRVGHDYLIHPRVSGLVLKS